MRLRLVFSGRCLRCVSSALRTVLHSQNRRTRGIGPIKVWGNLRDGKQDSKFLIGRNAERIECKVAHHRRNLLIVHGAAIDRASGRRHCRVGDFQRRPGPGRQCSGLRAVEAKPRREWRLPKPAKSAAFRLVPSRLAFAMPSAISATVTADRKRPPERLSIHPIRSGRLTAVVSAVVERTLVSIR